MNNQYLITYRELHIEDFGDEFYYDKPIVVVQDRIAAEHLLVELNASIRILFDNLPRASYYDEVEEWCNNIFDKYGVRIDSVYKHDTPPFTVNEIKSVVTDTWYELAQEHYEATAQEMIKGGGNENFMRQSVAVPMVKNLIKILNCDLSYFNELEVPYLEDQIKELIAETKRLQEIIQNKEN